MHTKELWTVGQGRDEVAELVKEDLLEEAAQTGLWRT